MSEFNAAITSFIDINSKGNKWIEKLTFEPYNLQIQRCKYNPNWYLLSQTVNSIKDFSYEGRLVRSCCGTVIEKEDKESSVCSVICSPVAIIHNNNFAFADKLRQDVSLRAYEDIEGLEISCIITEEKTTIWFTRDSFIDLIDPVLVHQYKPINGCDIDYTTLNELLDYALRSIDPTTEMIQRDGYAEYRAYWMANFPTGTTLTFRLTSAWYDSIVNYGALPNLWLLGGRDSNGYEMSISAIKVRYSGLPFDTPKEFTGVESIKDAIESLKNLEWKGTEHKGLILVDGNFNKVSVYSENYRELYFEKGKTARENATTEKEEEEVSTAEGIWKCVVLGIENTIKNRNEKLIHETDRMVMKFRELYIRLSIASRIDFTKSGTKEEYFKYVDENIPDKLKAICRLSYNADPNDDYSRAQNYLRRLINLQNGFIIFNGILEELVEFCKEK